MFYDEKNKCGIDVEVCPEGSRRINKPSNNDVEEKIMIENVIIRPFSNSDLNDFKAMFRTYFRDDFEIEITDEKIDEICLKIGRDSNSGLIPLDLLLIDEKPVGFICYQIDTPDSNWCEREGWGFIREIYVRPDLRGKHLGSTLVAHAEKELHSNGAEQIYLTSDEIGKFWISRGYRKTDKVSEINHFRIYEK